MARPGKITRPMENEMVSLRRQGRTYSDIAEMFGVSISSVGEKLKGISRQEAVEEPPGSLDDALRACVAFLADPARVSAARFRRGEGYEAGEEDSAAGISAQIYGCDTGY